jgi:YcxB-like protein
VRPTANEPVGLGSAVSRLWSSNNKTTNTAIAAKPNSTIAGRRLIRRFSKLGRFRADLVRSESVFDIRTSLCEVLCFVKYIEGEGIYLGQVGEAQEAYRRAACLNGWARYDYIRVQNDSLIEVNGTLTFRDLLKFQYSQCYPLMWWIVLPMTLFSLVGVILAALVALMTPNLELARQGGIPFLLLLLFWTCLVTSPYWAAKKLMKTQITLSSPITYVFSSQSVQSRGRHFSSEVSYEALWAVRETRSLFLLFFGAGSALVVPKRFFKDAIQENDWRSLVRQQISPKDIAKPGFLSRWL